MARTLTLFATICSTAVAALAQPGTPDSTFAGDGFQFMQPGPLHDNGYAVVALDDSSSVVCGVTSIGFSFSAYITRLLSDGSLDVTFGTNAGYTNVDLGEGTYFYDMVLDGDGNIYTCGLTNFTVASPSKILLAKFTSAGAPDPTFGTGGIVTTSLDTTIEAEAQALALQADGRIILAGRSGFGGFADAVVLRYNADGSLDNTFSSDGIAVVNTFAGDEDQFNGLDLLDDGSIIAAGHVNLNFVNKTLVAKLDPAGAFDSAFDSDGIMVVNLSPSGDQASAVVANGADFYLCGTMSPNQNNGDMYVALFDATGAPVTGFGTAGVGTMDIDANDQCYDMVLNDDGKIVVCGLTGPAGFGSVKSYTVARFLADGTVDLGFGTNGWTANPLGSFSSNALGVDITVDGKIMAAGVKADSDNDIAVARYLGDDGSVGVTNASASSSKPDLYPNPAHDRLFLRGAFGVTLLRVVDIAGHTVELRVASGAVDVSALPAGLYAALVPSGTRATFIKE